MTAPNGSSSDFFRLRMNVSGVAIVDRVLRGVESRALDLTPAWPQVVMAFRAIVKQAFDTEGASTDVGAWKALSPRTQQQRKRLGYGPAHPILQRSGRLYRALAEGEGAYERMEKQRLQIQLTPEIGTVFNVHQSLAPRTRIPRRAMVAFTADQRHQLLRPLVNHITGRARP